MMRLLIGFGLAGAVSAAAFRHRALAASGAVAATLAGAIAVAAGWSWAFLLIGYFVATSALSRLGARRKEARTGAIVAKGGTRDWRQVAANGGFFVVGAALSAAGWPHPGVVAFALGSLAAAAADSWATEIGTLAGGEPRSILTWKRMPPGMSGAVSLPGSIAMIAGAAFMALLAWGFGWDLRVVTAAAAGGVAGALFDSILGAAVQVRRRCPRCDAVTERRIHGCGSATEWAGGARWLDNDVVNVACAAGGGFVALLLAG